MAVGVAVIALAVAAPISAQVPDSARIGAPAVPPPSLAPLKSDSAARIRDSLAKLGPPISPKAAFFHSLLVPGWGQMKLNRPTAVAIFAVVEVGALAMLIQSKHQLNFAERMAGDSLTNADGTKSPNPYDARVESRKQAVEDWAFLLGFNHLISGIDAGVASALWDVPIQVGVRGNRKEPILYASIAW